MASAGLYGRRAGKEEEEEERPRDVTAWDAGAPRSLFVPRWRRRRPFRGEVGGGESGWARAEEIHGEKAPSGRRAAPPLPAEAMAAVVAKREGPQFISEAAVRGNAAILDYCRTSVSALSGATAGILGLNGLYGFIFYFLASVLLSVLLVLKAGRRWNKYFKSRRPLFTGGLIGGLFTYILFWTFLYGMVHVY
ncbi:ER membrane protein complex subunit 6-like [Thamnophis elegans]|nr:ER membrane protein complex subunit 6-like [Thamnophis elegans]